MTYKVNNDGSVALGAHTVPVPKTISREAQMYLATSPFTEAGSDEMRMPMWLAREFVDAQMLQLNEFARSLYSVEIEETQIAGVRCHWVRPTDLPAENAGKVLLNMHGGGFVMGSGALVEAIPVAHLAKVPVLAIDYRLAPEHPYPAAVDDCLAVYRAILADHAPAQIGVYGTSAGGFLTAQLAMRLRHENLPQPACLGVFTAGGDLHDFGDTAQIFTLMGFYGQLIYPLYDEISEVRAYLGDADRKDPLVSPIHGDLSGLPPVLLLSGTRDALLSSVSTYHRALRRAGVDADLFVFDAMPHAFWYALQTPEAREAIDIQVRFFLEHLGN